MSKGLDYSWARPGGQAIKDHGFQFVVRYIPFTGNGGKGIEAPEIADLRSHGIAIAVVFESSARRALDGRQAGKDDATTSQAQLARVGLDTNMPVYFAVDFDATPEQQAAIDEYLRGCADVLGAARVGVYAGYWIVKRCKENGTANYLWQTYAWSGGNVHPDINLYQYLNSQNVNGAVDFDEAKKADFGQENQTPVPAPTPPPAPAPAPPPAHTYTVTSGDTLSGIGQKTGTDWHQIAYINHISAPYTIYPGQVLTLPGGSAPPPPPPPSNTYVVKPGDTLGAIAAAHGTTYQHLAQINGIANPNLIYAGQVIKLS